MEQASFLLILQNCCPPAVCQALSIALQTTSLVSVQYLMWNVSLVLESLTINGLRSLLFAVAASICSACAHLLHRDELYDCCAQNLMISIRTDEGGHGRNTLVNTTLKVFDKAGGILEERELNTAEDLRAALESYFGIVPLTS